MFQRAPPRNRSLCLIVVAYLATLSCFVIAEIQPQQPLESVLLRVNQLPDFVGFSWSRADIQGPSSSRFISFLNEVRSPHNHNGTAGLVISNIVQKIFCHWSNSPSWPGWSLTRPEQVTEFCTIFDNLVHCVRSYTTCTLCNCTRY